MSLLVSAFVTIGGYLYPAYETFKLLKREDKTENELCRVLMYWTIMGMFACFEGVADYLISWVPFYYILKAAFQVYLLYPRMKGAEHLYKNYVQPMLTQHENVIDEQIRTSHERLSRSIKYMSSEAGVLAKRGAERVAVFGTQFVQQSMAAAAAANVQAASSASGADAEVTDSAPVEPVTVRS
eukprot:TRINITY_DN3275_c0_g1_i1.p1 TRINITY_DN3275_c0_g1~~TRINITY_DN3275_c0_g1_i1.p1  ORF type:complete len:196 (+),score=40.90 TRINITY_DN3275_c0_g1_i1:40-588(+)